MTARRSYEGTEVPVSRSQDECRSLLRKFGAEQFTFGEGRDWAGVEFIHADQKVRLRCPVKPGNPASVAGHHANTEKQDVADRREQARVWRVLVHSVKARLVAVEEGVESFEQSFLAHLVDPVSDRTMWEAVREHVEGGAFQIGGPGLRALGRG